jgi:hypothetical protein
LSTLPALNSPTIPSDSAKSGAAGRRSSPDAYGVAPLGGSVPGEAERRLRRRRPPGLHPRRPTCLQLGNDLVGDFLIKPPPVLTGAGASSVSGHRGSPRRALAEPLSTTLNPSRKTRPHSHSWDVAGCPRRRGCAGNRGAGQGEGVPPTSFVMKAVLVTLYAEDPSPPVTIGRTGFRGRSDAS